MKKYKTHINDIQKAGLDFAIGHDGLEEVVIPVMESIVNKECTIIEDCVLDADQLKNCFSIPFEDIRICEFDDNLFKTYTVEEARSKCELVKVKLEYLDNSDKPWCKFTNADTGEVVAERIHYNNFFGIQVSGRFLGEFIFELFLNSLKKYDGRESCFSEFFEIF